MTPTALLGATTAVVVTFNIGARFERYIAAYRDGFRRIVIVDNGSSDETASLVSELARADRRIVLIPLDRNLGLATAQNVGIAEALRERETAFVFLLDHDSCPSPASLHALASFASKTLTDETIGILGMRPVEEGHGDIDPKIAEASGPSLEIAGQRVTPVMTVMASGSLIRRSLFERFGRFDDAFFIDDVDHDFSLRLHCAGLRHLIVHDAVLTHNLGQRIEIPFLGKVRRVTWHSPFRRYYIVRNALWMWRRYFLRLPRYTAQDAYVVVRDTLKAILIDRTHRRANLQSVLRGVCDGLLTSPSTRPRGDDRSAA